MDFRNDLTGKAFMVGLELFTKFTQHSKFFLIKVEQDWENLKNPKNQLVSLLLVI